MRLSAACSGLMWYIGTNNVYPYIFRPSVWVATEPFWMLRNISITSFNISIFDPFYLKLFSKTTTLFCGKMFLIKFSVKLVLSCLSRKVFINYLLSCKRWQKAENALLRNVSFVKTFCCTILVVKHWIWQFLSSYW